MAKAIRCQEPETFVKLYNLAAGSNPRRVRIFLAEKGIEIPTIDIDMATGENRTDEFLAMNPLGTLPVLELDDGTILTESVAICRYFEELHPDPALFGTSVLERAQVEMWNRRVELGLLAPVAQAFRHGHPFWKDRLEQIEAVATSNRESAVKTMRWLDQELADRTFLVDDSYTVADITAQCAVLLGKNTGTPMPDDCANLKTWWERVSTRPTARA